MEQDNVTIIDNRAKDTDAKEDAPESGPEPQDEIPEYEKRTSILRRIYIRL